MCSKTMYGMDGVWKVSGRSLEGGQKVSKMCVEVFWKVSGRIKDQNFLDNSLFLYTVLAKKNDPHKKDIFGSKKMFYT